MEDVVRMFDPNGEMVLEHFKYGGADFEGCVPGSGELQVANTPYGKNGAIICLDADFPDIVKQAGEKEIDLLFVPANDWVEIRDLHSNMASFRAVENGMPTFRQTGGGVSSVTDAFGRTINRIDVFNQAQSGKWAGVQLVNVPIGSTNTIFPQAGNKFGL
jgi:apolipoprotein N-acyltransferase